MLETHASTATGSIGSPRSLRKIDFAKLVNYSPGRVTQLIKQGLPVEPDGRVPVAEARLWILENVKPVHKRPSRQGALDLSRPAILSERDRLAHEQANHVALKNAAMRRELVAAAEVEREWAGMIRQARSALLAVPSRLRQLIPGLSADEVAMIDAELRRVLEELAHAE